MPGGGEPERPAGDDPVVIALLRNRIGISPEVVAQAVIELEDAGLLRVETDADGGGARVLLPPARARDAARVTHPA